MTMISRRCMLQSLGMSALSLASIHAPRSAAAASRPNVILCMSDDQGWGDTGYNGHPDLKTPTHDRMAGQGIRFDRFYSAAPVCSPTRGSCLTGRHPFRYGIYGANKGHMKPEELMLSEVLQANGYTTGHFGKWHLGTLTKDIIDGRRGGRQNEHYAPPWEHGFDVCFSTEQAVPTWNPTENQRFPTKYWTGPGEYATANLDGDDSRVIMDRVIPFIQNAANNNQPFFAVIWFHAPHEIVIAGPKYRKMYSGLDENKQHFYGCITAEDDQIGRLQAELETLGVAGNTMFWFCSDNGPAGKGGGVAQEPGNRQQGSAGPFRGRKGSLYEGGVRVPAWLVWPGKIKQQVTTSIPCVTSDYFPTILELLDFHPSELDTRPYDGISLVPLLEGRMKERNHPIGFQHREQQSFCGERYKIITQDLGQTFELFDLIDDPGETQDRASDRPDVLNKMKTQLQTWLASCKRSDEGNDYAGG